MNWKVLQLKIKSDKNNAITIVRLSRMTIITTRTEIFYYDLITILNKNHQEYKRIKDN